MKIQSLLITLCITTLAACAVDTNDNAQVAIDNETRLRAEEKVREIVGGKAEDEYAIISTPAPKEQIVRDDRIKRDLPARQISPAVLQEYDVASAIEQVAGDKMMIAKRSQPSTGMVLNQIRHANEPLYRENYQHIESQNVIRVASEPVSTFSIDVDTGAYSNMRRWLNQGQLPPEDAVRVEEFINYFNYDYPYPKNQQTPFQVSTEIAPTPWNNNTRLLRIGIQGYTVPREQLPATNLVFLMDVSGSMNSADKLPLLKKPASGSTRVSR